MFNTQQFYIYSLLLHNIDLVDEKQIENIIKEEAAGLLRWSVGTAWECECIDTARQHGKTF